MFNLIKTIKKYSVFKKFRLSAKEDKVSNSVYVGNLSWNATEEQLSEEFAQFGNVLRIKLPTDRETGKKRGFAFVDFETSQSAQSAISKMNGQEFLGRPLKVSEAVERQPRQADSGYASDNYSNDRGGYRKDNRRTF